MTSIIYFLLSIAAAISRYVLRRETNHQKKLEEKQKAVKEKYAKLRAVVPPDWPSVHEESARSTGHGKV